MHVVLERIIIVFKSVGTQFNSHSFVSVLAHASLRLKSDACIHRDVILLQFILLLLLLWLLRKTSKPAVI